MTVKYHGECRNCLATFASEDRNDMVCSSCKLKIDVEIDQVAKQIVARRDGGVIKRNVSIGNILSKGK